MTPQHFHTIPTLPASGLSYNGPSLPSFAHGSCPGWTSICTVCNYERLPTSGDDGDDCLCLMLIVTGCDHKRMLRGWCLA